MATIDVVVGAQFGSEAKGHVTAQLIHRHQKDRQHTLNIRVAGPNAGHTVVDHDGNRIALRTIPVGAALNDPDTTSVQCYLAPGSEIQVSVLEDEIRHLNSLGHFPTVFVSDEATLLTDQHIETERNASMHERLGSTAKGIGAARADRIMRTALRIQDDLNALARLHLLPGVVIVRDHLSFIDGWLRDTKAAVVVEGTQGYGLGLRAGHYPKCTSSDTRAIDFLAMAGISPWGHHLNVWAVARVYPIRVAGDSGEMVGETTWEALGLDEEHTTVTKKVRRVSQWDPDLVRDAVRANGGAPTVKIALTMADQKIPQVTGWSGTIHDYTEDHPDTVHALQVLIRNVEGDAGTDVALVTTSDRTAVWL